MTSVARTSWQVLAGFIASIFASNNSNADAVHHLATTTLNTSAGNTTSRSSNNNETSNAAPDAPNTARNAKYNAAASQLTQHPSNDKNEAMASWDSFWQSLNATDLPAFDDAGMRHRPLKMHRKWQLLCTRPTVVQHRALVQYSRTVAAMHDSGFCANVRTSSA